MPHTATQPAAQRLIALLTLHGPMTAVALSKIAVPALRSGTCASLLSTLYKVQYLDREVIDGEPGCRCRYQYRIRDAAPAASTLEREDREHRNKSGVLPPAAATPQAPRRRTFTRQVADREFEVVWNGTEATA